VTFHKSLIDNLFINCNTYKTYLSTPDIYQTLFAFFLEKSFSTSPAKRNLKKARLRLRARGRRQARAPRSNRPKGKGVEHQRHP
jgi:hypothetical protein